MSLEFLCLIRCSQNVHVLLIVNRNIGTLEREICMTLRCALSHACLLYGTCAHGEATTDHASSSPCTLLKIDGQAWAACGSCCSTVPLLPPG